jgi:glutathionylspermidine synthase
MTHMHVRKQDLLRQGKLEPENLLRANRADLVAAAAQAKMGSEDNVQRILSDERPDYLATIHSQGLVYTHEDPKGDEKLYRYWRENAYYSFTSAEINVLEKAAKAVFEMCIEAGDWLLSDEGRPSLQRFGIPVYAMKAVIDSWNQEPANGSVYSRFDFRFGGLSHIDPVMHIPQLYEFNADTPTSLVESTIQWSWLEDTGNGNDQFNDLQDRLIAAWKRNLELIEQRIGHKPVVYFSCTENDESHEDEMNTILLMDTCQQSGYETKGVYVESTWVEPDTGRLFSKKDGDHIEVIFKLYPWEHIVHNDTARMLFADMEKSGYGEEPYDGGTIWIEPPYKMLWSTKALLPVLWKLFANDPRGKYLIPAWFDGEEPSAALKNKGYARKPILSREGADITLVIPGKNEVQGEVQGYGEEGYIIQELAAPPTFVREDENNKVVSTVLGIWMVDGEPAGMGIRESDGPITDNFSNFVVHSISDGPVNYQAKRNDTAYKGKTKE